MVNYLLSILYRHDCKLFFVQLGFVIGIWIILKFFSKFVSRPFYPHFSFFILPNICTRVPFRLSRRWRCSKWSEVLLFLSTDLSYNHTFFNCLGSGWLFYICSGFWSDCADVICGVLFSLFGFYVPAWWPLNLSRNFFLMFWLRHYHYFCLP